MILRLETPVGSNTQWFNVWASNDPADYASGGHGFYTFSVGYPNASAQIQAVGFIFGAADVSHDGGSMVVHTDSFAEGSWAGGPVWTTDFTPGGESPAPPDMIAVATTFPESGGQQAIVGGTDMKWLPNEWNACIQALEGHSGGIKNVVFSPDGSRVASGSDDKTCECGTCRRARVSRRSKIIPELAKDGGLRKSRTLIHTNASLHYFTDAQKGSCDLNVSR
jgi:WD40 repeat protein